MNEPPGVDEKIHVRQYNFIPQPTAARNLYRRLFLSAHILLPVDLTNH